MASRSKTANAKVFVEVLQNGEFLAETSRHYGKRSKVSITTSMRGSLPVPFYPLAHDIDLLHIDQKGVHLTLEPAWAGFVTCDGHLVNIQPGRRRTKTYLMRVGDYCSITLNDLRVLIRVGRDRVPKDKPAPRDKAYRGKLLPLIIGDKTDVKILSLGLAAATVIFGGFIFGLLNRPDDRPRRFEDLSAQYTLPFIHPQHLEFIPEALQHNLDRQKPLVSTINFYNRVTAMVLGYNTEENRFTFASSSQMYRNLYQENAVTLEQKAAAQREREDRLFSEPGNAIMTIPAVAGESFVGSLIRLQDKLTILHENFETNLDYRRQTTKSFLKDPTYDFNEYKKLTTASAANESLGKIRVWQRPTDEEAMYSEARELAKTAQWQRQRIKKSREPIIAVTPESAAPITIPADIDFASFIHNSQFVGLNDKLAYINASEFGRRAPVKIKEPLIGEIDPKLIEQTIAKNKFELQLCFELALRRNQLVGGTMEWQWRLDSRGSISDLSLVTTSIKDRGMISCVRQKIARWKFPRPRRGSIEIRYPFQFDRIKS